MRAGRIHDKPPLYDHKSPHNWDKSLWRVKKAERKERRSEDSPLDKKKTPQACRLSRSTMHNRPASHHGWRPSKLKESRR